MVVGGVVVGGVVVGGVVVGGVVVGGVVVGGVVVGFWLLRFCVCAGTTTVQEEFCSLNAIYGTINTSLFTLRG